MVTVNIKLAELKLGHCGSAVVDLKQHLCHSLSHNWVTAQSSLTGLWVPTCTPMSSSPHLTHQPLHGTCGEQYSVGRPRHKTFTFPAVWIICLFKCSWIIHSATDKHMMGWLLIRDISKQRNIKITNKLFISFLYKITYKTKFIPKVYVCGVGD